MIAWVSTVETLVALYKVIYYPKTAHPKLLISGYYLEMVYIVLSKQAHGSAHLNLIHFSVAWLHYLGIQFVNSSSLGGFGRIHACIHEPGKNMIRWISRFDDESLDHMFRNPPAALQRKVAGRNSIKQEISSLEGMSGFCCDALYLLRCWHANPRSTRISNRHNKALSWLFPTLLRSLELRRCFYSSSKV